MMSVSPKEIRAPFTWRSAAMTNQGNVRDHNEDAILDNPEVGLWEWPMAWVAIAEATSRAARSSSR
jgi:hypothetical protein